MRKLTLKSKAHARAVKQQRPLPVSPDRSHEPPLAVTHTENPMRAAIVSAMRAIKSLSVTSLFRRLSNFFAASILRRLSAGHGSRARRRFYRRCGCGACPDRSCDRLQRGFAAQDSLMPPILSLLCEIISLLILIGNSKKIRCGAAVSRDKTGSQGSKMANFPVKFPVSREFARRRVRSALRRQPGSPGLGENAPDSIRKAGQQPAFAIRGSVSVLPVSRNEARIRGKSLANTANIPVFERRRSETGVDQDCMVRAAVDLAYPLPAVDARQCE
jgi:hypothetical protein